MELLDCFNFPESSKIQKRIPLKDIIDELSLSGTDKTTLEKSVSSVYLIAILDRTTTRILEYSDDTHRIETIFALEVSLRSSKNISYCIEKLHQAFQNPVILLLNHENQYLISCSIKRLSRSLVDKTVIEEVISTDPFELDDEHMRFCTSLDIRKYRIRNLYELINKIADILESERLINILGVFPEKTNSRKDISDNIRKYVEIISRKKSLVEQYKKESMMSRKMDIHEQIQKIDDIVSILKLNLIEGGNNGQDQS